MRLAVVFENIKNFSVTSLDDGIGIDPAPLGKFGNLNADSRFARTHHAAKNDIHSVKLLNASR